MKMQLKYRVRRFVAGALLLYTFYRIYCFTVLFLGYAIGEF